MKYKLKLDCPKYRAGEMFHISSRGNLVHTNSGKLAYSKKDLKEYPTILKDWFEEIPDSPKTVYDLGIGDNAWFIEDGGIKKYVGMDEIELNLIRDKAEVGDGYITREDAQKELARRKARATLLRDTKGFKPDWNNNGQCKCSVYFDCDDKKLNWVNWGANILNEIVFNHREDAEASIKAHEKEWKVYLRVEE